jgi:hypothetical protein
MRRRSAHALGTMMRNLMLIQKPYIMLTGVLLKSGQTITMSEMTEHRRLRAHHAS